MTNPGLVLLPLWMVFWIYWLISAQGVKQNIKKDNAWRQSSGIRLVLTAIVILFFIFFGSSFSSWQIPGYSARGGAASSLTLQIIGIALCAGGIAFAIWARRHLGTNWSGTPSIKEGHELVTSGPYRFVRHPIYTGLLFAILGSAIVAGVFWFIVFIYFVVVLIYRVKVEEQFMMDLFPDVYPEYRKRTKALLPFIW